MIARALGSSTPANTSRICFSCATDCRRTISRGRSETVPEDEEELMDSAEEEGCEAEEEGAGVIVVLAAAEEEPEAAAS